MTCEKTRSLIQKYEAPEDFTHTAVDTSYLHQCEKVLNHRLPGQYMEFLTTYSQGGIFGIVTLGINAFGEPTFLKATEDYRLFGLPENLLVIEEDDNNANYCLNLNDESVAYWHIGEDTYQKVYPDFCSYLTGRIADSIKSGPLPVLQ